MRATTADRPVPVAVLGTGTVSDEHIRAYLANPASRLVGIAGRTRERAVEKVEAMGLDHTEVRCYDGIDELIDDPHVSAVSICTPDHLHVDHALSLAAAGKHILLEKPAALDEVGLQKVVDVVDQMGVVSAVGFVLRWNPFVQTAGTLIREGVLGDLVLTQVDYWHNATESGYPAGKEPPVPRSAMVTGGCHAVDLARHFNSESDIVSVAAMGVRESDGAFANQVAVLRFANGGMAKVSACTDQWMPYQFNIDVLGTSGSLRENRLATKALRGVDGWTTFSTVTPTSGLVDDHPFAGEIDHFLDCVMSGHESPTSIRRTANVHRACFAIDASCALEGALVPL